MKNFNSQNKKLVVQLQKNSFYSLQLTNFLVKLSQILYNSLPHSQYLFVLCNVINSKKDFTNFPMWVKLTKTIKQPHHQFNQSDNKQQKTTTSPLEKYKLRN